MRSVIRSLRPGAAKTAKFTARHPDAILIRFREGADGKPFSTVEIPFAHRCPSCGEDVEGALMAAWEAKPRNQEQRPIDIPCPACGGDIHAEVVLPAFAVYPAGK